MGIDDPAFDRALKQLEMEELHEGPPLAKFLARAVINVSKAVGALVEENLLEAITAFRDVHDAMAADRSLYLLFCLNEDVKRLRSGVEEFSQKQREYLETDFVALMLDADEKARRTRSQSRIRESRTS
jgi:hypothetical protein